MLPTDFAVLFFEFKVKTHFISGLGVIISHWFTINSLTLLMSVSSLILTPDVLTAARESWP